MPLSKQGRFSFWFILAMVAIGAVTTAIESSSISASELHLYLGLRIPLLALGLHASFLFRRNPYSSTGHFLFGALLILYTIHGQWYRPFYEYTFFQAMAFYTLLLYPPKKVFLTLLILGSALFMLVYAYRFDTVVLNSRTTLEENYTGILAFALTLFGIFKVFSEERAFKEQAIARFGLLGKHSATILHDLKSTMAIPRIYSELAEEALEKGNADQARLHLKECVTSLDSMQSVIVQLNQMTELIQLKSESVDLREVIDEVREVLRVKIRGINFDVRGHLQVEVSRSFLFSMILNLVLNSAEVFERKKISHPTIQFTMSPNKLIFEDNGGGFPLKVIERIETGTQASTKNQASGLGLFLLRDGIRRNGGRVSYSNSNNGVIIEIQFKS